MEYIDLRLDMGKGSGEEVRDVLLEVDLIRHGWVVDCSGIPKRCTDTILRD
jgi:hypothetical protein